MKWKKVLFPVFFYGLCIQLSYTQCSFSLNMGKQDVACYGDSTGKAYVTVTGGSGSFSFQWNTVPPQTTDTAFNLPVGTYTVIVTDLIASCSDTDSITVLGPGNPLQYFSFDYPPSCPGDSDGMGYVEVLGGTPPYTIQWFTLSPPVYNDSALSLWADTFLVAIQDANGCKDTAPVIIHDPIPLSLVTGANPPLCTYTNDGITYVSVSGGSPPYTYAWNTTPAQFNDTAVSLSPGTYQVVVTDNKGCKDSATAIVPPNNNPIIITFTGVIHNNCFGDSTGQATASASGGQAPYTYLWNIYNNIIPNATVTGLTAGNYKVYVTDANNCIDSAMITINEPPALVLSLSATPELCGDGSGSATATVNGGTPLYSYAWNTSPIQTTPTASSLSSGWYKVLITDANNCQISDSIFVSNNNGGMFVNAFSQDVICNGQNNGMAWAQASGGNGTYLYQWNTSPVQNNDTAFNLPPGMYIVTAIDGNNCMAYDTVIITEPPLLQVTLTTQNAICTASNGIAVAQANGGIPPYSYTWYTSPLQFNDTATGLYPGLYNVLVEDNNGCQTLATATISANNITLAGNIVVVSPISCYGDSNGIITVNINNGTPPYSFLWNTTPPQTNDTLFNLPAGNYAVNVTDQNGCTGQVNYTLNQPNDINLFIQYNNDFGNNCTGYAQVFPSGGTPPYTYLWTPGNFTTDSISNLCAGFYCVTVTDSKGCIKNGCVQIFGSSACQLNVTANVTNVSCAGYNNGTLQALIYGNYGPYTVTWYDSNNQPVSNPSAVGPGSYYVVVVDSAGCVDTTNAFITEPLPIVTTIATTAPLCPYNCTGTAEVTYITGGTPPYAILWLPQLLNTTFISNLCVGDYQLVITDMNECADTTAFTISSISQIDVQVSSISHATCTLSDGSAGITVSGNFGNYTVLWSTGENTLTINEKPAGVYEVIVTDELGCSDNTTVNILSVSNITVDKQVSHETCAGYFDGSALIKVTYGVPPFLIVWETGETSPGIATLTAGTYSFTVKDARNCLLKDTLTVFSQSHECINIPNAFTPNNDGDNDYWILRGHQNYPDIHIKIFNRWGLLVYESKGYDVPWDGKRNGKLVPVGTYYYIIDLGNNTPPLKGDVTILY